MFIEKFLVGGSQKRQFSFFKEEFEDMLFYLISHSL